MKRAKFSLKGKDTGLENPYLKGEEIEEGNRTLNTVMSEIWFSVLGFQILTNTICCLRKYSANVTIKRIKIY